MSSEQINEDKLESYTESVWLSIFVVIAIILLEGILIFTAIFSAINEPESRILTITLCSSIGLFLLLVFINYSVLKITITKDEINIRFGLFNKRKIPLSDLIEVEEVNASFKLYLGFGVRIGTDGSIAYTTRFGPAVKLVAENSRAVVVTSNNPEGIIEFINQIQN